MNFLSHFSNISDCLDQVYVIFVNRFLFRNYTWPTLVYIVTIGSYEQLG